MSTPSPVLQALLSARVVAIIRLERYDRATEIARALAAGGIRTIEYTLTGAGAHDAIRKARADLGDSVYVGVGTVLNAKDATDAIDAGATFVVTPVVALDAIAASRARGVPIICGAQTPTEAFQAHQAGADMIKIFPARTGGPAYIKDILAPLPFLKLVPTGGISPETARAFLDAGAAAVGMGGNLVSAADVAAGNWDSITAKARIVVAAVGG